MPDRPESVGLTYGPEGDESSRMLDPVGPIGLIALPGSAVFTEAVNTDKANLPLLNRAVARQGFGNGPPDAPRGAGHQRCLSVQLRHASAFPSVPDSETDA